MKNKKTNPVFKPAPTTRRFVAFIIDWYLSSMFAMIPVVIAASIQESDLILSNRIDGLPLGIAAVVTGCAFILYVLYFCVLPLRQTKNFKVGQTIGRKLMHLTLVDVNDKPLNFKALFIRDYIGFLLLQGVLTSTNIYLMSLTQMITQTDVVPYFQSVYFVVAGLSTLYLIFGSRKQTIHDRLSNTRMVISE